MESDEDDYEIEDDPNYSLDFEEKNQKVSSYE